jgi:hypothetical protein
VDLAQQLQHRLVDDGDAVGAAGSGVDDERDDRQDGAGDGEGAANPERGQEHRGEDAAGDAAGSDEALEDGEHRRALVVRGAPLDDREQRDVVHRVRHADDDEGRQGDRGRRDQADHGDGRAPVGERRTFGADEAVGPGQADREHGADQPSQPERRVQQADARLAHRQQLDGGDDEERGQERPGHDLAEHAEHAPAHDRPAAPGAQPIQEPDPAGRRPGPARRVALLFESQPGDAERRGEEGEGRGQGPELRSLERDEDAGDEWADHRPETLARAPGHVRRNELARAARDRGHERRLRGAHDGPGGGPDRREDEQQDRRRSGRDDEHAQAGSGGPNQSHREEHPLATEPLDRGAGEHARQHRGHHPDRAERARGHDPVAREDDHEQHHEQPGVAGDAERPRRLEAPDALVGHGLAQGAQERADRAGQGRHAAPRMARGRGESRPNPGPRLAMLPT